MLEASSTTRGIESGSFMRTLNTMVEQGIQLGAIAMLAFSGQTIDQV